MSVKPKRVSISVTASVLEEAIAQLSQKFLRFNKTSIRAVSQPTEHRVVELCDRLIEDWQSGKVPYEPGTITLSFSTEPHTEADLLVYKPAAAADSDNYAGRLLYSRRNSPLPKPSRPKSNAAPLHLPLDTDALQPILQQLHSFTEVLEELTAAQRALEVRASGQVGEGVGEGTSDQKTGERENWWVGQDDFSTPTSQAPAGQSAQNSKAESYSAAAVPAAPDLTPILQQLHSTLERHQTDLTQKLSSQLTVATLQLNERLNKMQGQIDQLIAQLEVHEEDTTPQNETQWRSRLQETWGTVGDYEQYSASHREINAETPLFHTPDWVMLCELPWAREMQPALRVLHQLIHEENGIGYAGADILQQFGRHIDPRTGDRYYIYELGGYSAADALWKTVHHPQHSWLPELRRLSKRLVHHPEVFEMFGWEKGAIAALDQVVQQATYQQQQANQSRQSYQNHQNYQNRQSSPNNHQRAGNTLSDYLAVLNLGPFSPLTLEVIKQAYKQAMKIAHPDTGGSKEQAQRVNEAYEAIVRHYFPNVI